MFRPPDSPIQTPFYLYVQYLQDARQAQLPPERSGLFRLLRLRAVDYFTIVWGCTRTSPHSEMSALSLFLNAVLELYCLKAWSSVSQWAAGCKLSVERSRCVELSMI